MIAFTGYEGILGYRTADKYADSKTYEQDRREAARVAQCLKDNGWELASHSWGHLMVGGESKWTVSVPIPITGKSRWTV